MAIRSTHPLRQDMTHLQNWKQWMEMWNNNPCLEVRHSLLHFGLEMPLGTLYGEETGWKTVHETYTERILFYLSAADGWCLDPQHFALELSEDRSYGNDPKFNTSLGVLKGNGDLRQRLAQKAYASLFSALIPFSEKKGSEEERRRGLNHYDSSGKMEWGHVYHMTQQEVIALLRFFRPVGGSPFKGIYLQNLPRGEFYGPLGDVSKHFVERVRKFLADYLVFLWNKKMPEQPKFYGKPRNSEEERRQEEVQKCFEEEVAFHKLLKRHRFLMAVMLLCLGENERMYPLGKDERTLKLFHQFAMGMEVKSEVYNEEHHRLERLERKPCSLEEAYRYGSGPRSEAAKFLLLRGITEKAENEHKKWEQPHRERAQRARSQQEQEAREKEAEALRKKADELLQGSHS